MKLLYRLFYHLEPGSDQERKVMKSAISMAGFIWFSTSFRNFSLLTS